MNGTSMLRHRVRAVVPEHLRLRARLLQNNVSALLPKSDRVYLSVNRSAEHLWRVSDGKRDIYVPSFRRWWRYRNGIDTHVARLAHSYGHGTYFEIGAGDVVLDIGANVGEFSMFAASRGARVFSVEADDFVFALLSRNTVHFPSITRISAAVWKETGVIEFYSSPEGADSSTIAPTDAVQAKYYKPASKLDDLIANLGVDRIKLVKCDAEGAEPEVLQGGRRLLREKVEWVAFDCGFERRGESTWETCQEILRDIGFVPQNPDAPGVRRILVARNAAL